MNKHKLFLKIKRGNNNVRFDDFKSLVETFGYRIIRINGSHHIFKHPNVPEFLNLQARNGQVKPYQVREFLGYVEKYGLTME